MESLNGLIIVDKPAGMLSTRVVGHVKRLLPRGTKVGHAGTLDSFATGVLVLLVGKATRLCEQMMDRPKQYEATVKLGATTATDDPDSPEEAFSFRGADASPALVSSLDQHGRGARAAEIIQSALNQFVGQIQQRPPRFSALKLGGKRASDRVRLGEQIRLEPRTINVYAVELIDYEWPLLRLRIDCSRGTYVRSIARDLGETLKVGGYLTQLRRTRVGDFTVDRAVTLEKLIADGVMHHLVCAA